MRTPLAHLAAAAAFAALITSYSFAQSEPIKPIDPAVKQAQEKLPEDQPKGTTSRAVTTPAATSATTTAATTTAPSGQPSEADMMMKMMMEMSKLNENHKLLGQLVGTWTFTNKMWMNPDPKAPPSDSKGMAIRKAMMDGRYYNVDVTGKMPLPGPDGKMTEVDFKGQSIEGYDNAKQKFVSTWLDSMSTGVFLSEGTYDAATKTFTYTGVYDMAPGVKQKVRETLKIVDADHHLFEWYEDHGGKEVRTMEIAYTRKK